MRVLAMVTLLGGCELAFPLDPPPPIGRTVTIDQPTAMTLADFPVHIGLLDDDLRQHADPGGRDIKFLAADDTELASEIGFDATSGSLTAWVRIPSLTPEPVEIRLVYGDGKERAAVASDVWSPSFIGVWHLDEPNGPVTDSTSNGFNLLAPGPDQTPKSTPGVAGGARVFDGVDDSVCAITEAPNFGTSAFSFGAWVFFDNTTLGPLPITKGGTIASEAGFSFQATQGDTLAGLSNGAGFLQSGAGGAFSKQWMFLRASVDPVSTMTMRLFLDGQDTNHPVDIPTGFDVDAMSHLCFGGKQVTTMRQFPGALDEVRIYNGIQAAEWIAAEHANLVDPDTFVRVAPVE